MATNLESLMGTPDHPQDCVFKQLAFRDTATFYDCPTYAQILYSNYPDFFGPILDALAAKTECYRTDFLYDFLAAREKADELDAAGELTDQTLLAAFGIRQYGCDHDNFIAQRWYSRDTTYRAIFALYATKSEGIWADKPAIALFEIDPA